MIKWYRARIVTVLVLVLLAGLTAAPTVASASSWGDDLTLTVRAPKGLRLRQGPSLGDSVVFTLYDGEQVTKIGGPVWNQGISWTHVRVWRWGYSYEGFCASAYLTNYAGYQGPSMSGLQVTASGLNLRSGPGLEYGVRRIVPYGTILQPTGATQWASGRQWTQVEVAGVTLWAASAYLATV